MALERTIGVLLAILLLGFYLCATTPKSEGSLKVSGRNIALVCLVVIAIIVAIRLF